MGGSGVRLDRYPAVARVEGGDVDRAALLGGLLGGVAREHGLVAGHRLDRHIRVLNAPPTERGGYDAARQLLADVGTVTAVFTGNDLTALGVLDALAEHGLEIPRDMSVAGYDNTPVAALRMVSLTTVDQFATEIGAEAMRSVLARVKRRDRSARHVLVPPRLIPRATTAAPSG